jgi:membrane protease YdiL (CAAX protease family)
MRFSRQAPPNMTEPGRDISGEATTSAPLAQEIIPLARPVGALDEARELPGDSARRSRHDDPMLLRDMGRGHAALDVVVIIAGLIFAEILFGTALGAAGVVPPKAVGEDGWAAFRRSLLVPSLMFRTVVVAGLVWVMLRARGETSRSVGLTTRQLPINLLLGPAAALVSSGLAYAYIITAVILFPSLERDARENASLLEALIPRMSIWAFALLAMTIGFYEELLVRGFLMTRLRRATNSWVLAVLISTALFVAPHAWDQAAPLMGNITILSLVFSIVTIWRRSLVPAILGHAIFNWVQFIVMCFTAGEDWK